VNPRTRRTIVSGVMVIMMVMVIVGAALQ